MQEKTTLRINMSRTIYFALASLFVLCVAVQIWLAGMALFTDSSYWSKHVVFVRIFELFPVLMLIFAFAGRMPSSFRWRSIAIFLLIYAQYFTAHFSGAGAYHPVIAAVLFWISLHTAMNAKKILKPVKNKKVE